VEEDLLSTPVEKLVLARKVAERTTGKPSPGATDLSPALRRGKWEEDPSPGEPAQSEVERAEFPRALMRA
jgi:hypothetical protein